MFGTYYVLNSLSPTWHIGCHEVNVVFDRTSRLIDVQVRNQYGVQVIAVGLVGYVGKL